MTDQFDLSGIKLIGEMTTEEIIDELTDQWRKDLRGKEVSELKQMLIAVRIDRIQTRMIEEAGLVKHRGIFGTHLHEKGEFDND